MIEETSKNIADRLAKLPKFWDGKEAVVEMKESGSRQWRQMEWIGFYFEFLCERFLTGHMRLPGPKYGNVSFDGFLEVPWDFKTHAMNTSSHKVIVNDLEAVQNAVAEHGCVGLILALGTVQYNDEDRSFQKWHNQLKGGKSKYERERIRRGAWSRLRKQSLTLEQISLIRITTETLEKCGSFQERFRNANGSPRRAKLILDLEKIEDEIVHVLEF